MAADHIAIFLPSLEGGGAERNMVNLSKGLVDMGRRVTIIASHAVGAFIDEVPDQVDIVDLECPRTFSSFSPLVRELNRLSPDVLLSTMNYANVIAIMASKSTRKRLPVFVREANTLSKTEAQAENIREQAVPVLARWFYPNATQIVSPSQGVADDLVDSFEMPISKSIVINNPVVDDSISSLAAQLPSGFSFPKKIPVVLGCGSFSEQKDFPTLIRAFSKLRERRKAKLVILGKGKLYDSYLRLVSELGLEKDVVFPGFVSNPFAFMSRASVFVLSSKWEGLPNVPIQALACGCPVVSTDCPSGPREILSGGRFGALVPVGDVEALSNAIGRTLDAPLSKEILKKRAADFTVEAIAQQYADMFDGAMN